MKTVSKSFEETKGFASEVLDILRKENRSGAEVLHLVGDLGAGKTTLTQMIGEILGVKEQIQSPTFVIMKSYKTKDPVFKTLVHIDAYRIEKPEETRILNLEKIFNDPENLVCVEWGEKLGSEMPLNTKKIICTLLPDDVHSFEFIESN